MNEGKGMKGRTLDFVSITIIFIMFSVFSCTEVSRQAEEHKYINIEKAVSLLKEEKAAMVDTMSDLECMDHRIPGSVCIAAEEFEAKAPLLLQNKKQHVVFYCESEECTRAGIAYDKARSAGYENIYILEGGLPAWKRAGNEVETVRRVKREPVVSIKPDALAKMAKKRKDLFILDVRSEDAFRAGHVEGAVNIPLYTLQRRLSEIPDGRPVIVIDENGKRSFIVCCYLINKGFKDVTRLYGGMRYEGPQKGKKR